MQEIHATIRTLGLLVAAIMVAGCMRHEQTPVTYERAVEISRQAAKEHGYDLGKYRLDTFGDPAADKGKWLVAYLCGPEPPPPGCSFIVVVDRRTGDTEVYPGQ